jgi:hypothetical protein
MLFHQMKCLVLLFSSFIILIAADQHLNANGPFGKRHLTTEAPSPYACNRSIGASSTTVTEITLNVTAIVYSSNEQINVTWTSTSTPCIDDFIGIYFVKIPLSAGKDINYWDLNYFRFDLISLWLF